jgi:cytochrome c oxidase assembly factor CtaG
MKTAGLVFITIVFLSPPASAHDVSGLLSTGSAWTYDPWLLAPLYCVGIGFYVGTLKLWRAAGFGRGIGTGQAAAFWCGWTILALVVTSPLHWLGEHLFVAHMTEHELLMVVAAPLLAYGRLSGAMPWAFPRWLRPWLGRALSSTPLVGVWRILRHPLTATALHGATLWLWHAPILYQLALTDETVHRLQHLSFFLAALLFWWVLLHGRGAGHGERTRGGIAIGCLFITVLHSGLLGALLTLSSHVWYPEQSGFTADFGLSPIEDQQLAGLVMWIPMGGLYTGAALAFAYAWMFDQSHRRAPPQTDATMAVAGPASTGR